MLKNLLKLLKKSKFSIERIESVEIIINNQRVRFRPDQVFVWVEGEFSGRQLHKELERLGIVGE